MSIGRRIAPLSPSPPWENLFFCHTKNNLLLRNVEQISSYYTLALCCFSPFLICRVQSVPSALSEKLVTLVVLATSRYLYEKWPCVLRMEWMFAIRSGIIPFVRSCSSWDDILFVCSDGLLRELNGTSVDAICLHCSFVERASLHVLSEYQPTNRTTFLCIDELRELATSHNIVARC